MTNAAGSELGGQKMEARLVQHAEHFAEQHVDAAGALLHDGVEAEDPAKAEHDGSSDEHADRR